MAHKNQNANAQQASSQVPDSTAIVIDIACPDCEYNLRGLPGPIVSCPECGLSSDVAELATRQWDKPWYKAPGFNTLIWPAVCVWFGWFFVIPFVAASSSDGLSVLITFFVGLALWVFLMYRAYRVFGRMLGVWLALAMHLLVVGYLAAVIGFAAVVVLGVLEVTQATARVIPYVYGLLAFSSFAILFWISRRVERAIAGACIRHYLRRKPTS